MADEHGASPNRMSLHDHAASSTGTSRVPAWCTACEADLSGLRRTGSSRARESNPVVRGCSMERCELITDLEVRECYSGSPNA